MKSLYIFKLFNFTFRIIIFIFSYILYLIQLVLIFFNIRNYAKSIFFYSAYFCSLSLGITYEINKNYKIEFLRKGIHISNHDNPLDIFAAQYLFRMRTITTVDQHLKNFLPFFEISLKNYGHYCFNYKDFNQRKLAYLFLNKVCRNYKNVLIYPSGSLYTSITKRLSKSVSKLSMKNNLEVIAWNLCFEDNSNIHYDRNISKYILKRFSGGKIIFRVNKFKVFNPNEYKNYKDLHKELIRFYIS